MRGGKKVAVEAGLREAFSRFKIKNYPKHPLPLLFRHLLAQRPLFVLSHVRRGKEVKEVPIPLASRRQLVLVLNWYVIAIKSYVRRYLSEKIYRDLKAIKANRRTALMKYKKSVAHNFRIVVNRFNQRFRWR
jgi:ribosomal protein S7